MKQYDDDAEKFGYEGEMELMKCDELKWKWAYGPYLDPPEGQKESAIKAGYVKVVSKQSADEAIAELKEAWRSEHEACEALKQELDEKDNDIAYWREEYDKETKLTDALNAEIESLKASHYAESVDAGMRERRLRRTLWLARSEKAKIIAKIYSKEAELTLLREHYPSGCGFCHMMNNKWKNVERKCLKKAEEYK